MLQTGQTIERYTVEAVIGQGGMAVVYRVRHNQLGSQHALKILTVPRPRIRERLLQEGKVQAGIRHPNVVQVTDVLEIEGAPALLMEFVDGPSLDDWLTRFRPSVPEAEGLFRGIVEGVEEAHHHGLVHRDLKPANVLLARTRGGFLPKVTDFGIAKHRFEADEFATRSNAAMGTPAYMAPEQIRDAKNVDHRADVFSLGCILYELVCGTRPFTGPDVLAVFNKVAEADYPHPREFDPNIPDHLVRAITQCLEADRERRLPDCHSVLQVLDGGGATAAGAAMRIRTGWDRPARRHASQWTPTTGERDLTEGKSLTLSLNSHDTMSFPQVDLHADTVPTAATRVYTPAEVVDGTSGTTLPAVLAVIVVGLVLTAVVAAAWLAQTAPEPTDQPVAPATP